MAEAPRTAAETRSAALRKEVGCRRGCPPRPGRVDSETWGDTVTLKASEIINKVMGAGMIIASVSFFAYLPGNAPYIIPGLIFGAGGFLLALKRDRHPPADLQAQQRVEELAESLAATQLELTSAQERLDRLEEERDFMRQLAAPAQVLHVAEGQAAPDERTDENNQQQEAEGGEPDDEPSQLVVGALIDCADPLLEIRDV